MRQIEMKEIKHPESYEICQFDGVTVSTIYTGGFANLKPVADKLSWHENKETGELIGMQYLFLTLSEIRDQIRNLHGGECPMITIFSERALGGSVLQYGNYGDSWWQVGDLSGYA
jgi:hypothetical protein